MRRLARSPSPSPSRILTSFWKPYRNPTRHAIDNYFARFIIICYARVVTCFAIRECVVMRGSHGVCDCILRRGSVKADLFLLRDPPWKRAANADVYLFRQTVCSNCASMLLKCTATVILGKCRVLMLSAHLLLSSVQTAAYRETDVSNRLSRKPFILEPTCMILVNKIFIPSPNAAKLQVCNLTSVSFRHHFIVCSLAEDVKLFLS